MLYWAAYLRLFTINPFSDVAETDISTLAPIIEKKREEEMSEFARKEQVWKKSVMDRRMIKCFTQTHLLPHRAETNETLPNSITVCLRRGAVQSEGY